MADFREGDVFEERWTVDDSLIERFADLSGDRNPVHLNSAEARSFGFAKPLAHGALSVALLSRLIGMKVPGPGALWLSQQIEWLAPIYVGDDLVLSARIRHYSNSTQILTLEIEGRNQSHALVLKGEAKVKVTARLTEPACDATPKLALVTGGSRGIGAAIARRLSQEGLHVILNFLSQESTAKDLQYQIVSKTGSCQIVQGDLSCLESTRSMLERLNTTSGCPDIIVHCATPSLAIERYPNINHETIDRYLRIYVHGAIELLNWAAPTWKTKRFGRLIVIGTSALFGQPPSGYGPYIIAKSALWGFVRSAAQELGPFGITVNMVSPGLTITDLTADVPSRVKELEARKTAVRRLATPEDTAALVSFLATPAAGYLNGLNLPVTGGPI